jgi:hypothetical protein
MKVAIGQKLMPTAVQFMKRMSAWFGDKANQQMIKDFATDIGEIAAALVKVTGQVSKANSFFERFGSAKKYIEAFMNPLGSMSRHMVEVALSADKVWAAIRRIISAIGDIKIGPFGDLSGAVRRLLGPLGSALSAIDSILRKLGLIKDTGPIFVPVKVKFTTIGSVDWPSTMGTGDASEGLANTSGAGYGWASNLARQFGNVVTSTYRPGAITASGNVSDHGTYGRAADLADGLGNMARLWNYVKSTAGSWKQAIYQHQMINYGKLGYYGPSDHFDHVHLARRSMGGVVKRAEVSLIGESGPEAIIPLTRPARARQVMQEAGLAGAGGGSVTYNVNVVVPGGTTLIGTAREVGEILAPHVARAVGRATDRAGRRR